MDPLVTVLVTARRSARRAGPLVGAMVLGAAVLLDAAAPLEPPMAAVLGALLAVLLAVRGWRRTRAVDHPLWRDLEVGALLLVAAYAVVVHVDRSLSGRAHALVYVAVAILSAFAHPAASAAVIAASVAYEAALMALGFDGIELGVLGPHAALMGAVALVNVLSLRLEVTRLRRAARTELAQERDRIRDEARSYRLLRAPSDLAPDVPEPSVRAQDEERLLRSGVEEIQQSVLLGLRLLRECLGLHTALLLWLDERGSSLRIAELDTEADDAGLSAGPFSGGDGILGAVLAQRAAVSLSELKPSYVLPYYADVCPVRSVHAAPVFEHGTLRGVLVVDRREPHAFGPAAVALVEQAARFAARAIENERVFVQLERTKVEQGKLYRASERLGASSSEQEVVEAGVSSASEIATVDFAAFTSYEPSEDAHQIRSVRGEGAFVLEGQRFAGNTGLVSMALRNRHPLPYRGIYDPARQVVFARRLSPPAMPSLLVLPLVVHEEPLGTLVLGSSEPGAFGEAARNLLEVLANHMAVSLSNARMVRRLEEQATTDGLTGLLNKRALLDTAEEKLSAARRFGRQLSVLVADIDLFKRVNDNYGHDVGDVVIKELGAIHQRVKRTTDSVARFGGEEFVTICEETDARGALLLAERIRDELRRTIFHAGGEQLRCTCSVGIATFPVAGASWEELFHAADEALYASKHNGRDRVTIWEPRHSHGGHAAA